MKTQNLLICFVLFFSTFLSCKTNKHSSSSDKMNYKKLIVKEFPIDTNDRTASQRALETEQMRLMRKYPGLRIEGVIAPNSPWILVTEQCDKEKNIKKLRKKLLKDCPDAKIVSCN
jgi:hypothetical protein